MAINTLDAAIAGTQSPIPIIKTGTTMAAVGATRCYTPWYANGNPGPSVAPTIGVNGQAVTPALATPAGVVGGRIPRNNPGAGDAHPARLVMNTTQNGFLMLVDRLWHNSGLSTTLTTSQAIAAAAALPARCSDGTANGLGVIAGIEWSATGGAGVPTATLTYTDQAGVAGRTAIFTSVASPPVGTVELFAGSSTGAQIVGVRTPTAFQWSATHTSGAFHLVLWRILGMMSVGPGALEGAIDVLTSGRPKVYNDTVEQLLFFPSATTATTFLGCYAETQG